MKYAYLFCPVMSSPVLQRRGKRRGRGEVVQYPTKVKGVVSLSKSWGHHQPLLLFSLHAPLPPPRCTRNSSGDEIAKRDLMI